MFVKPLVALATLAILYNIGKRGVRIPFLRRSQTVTPEPAVEAVATQEVPAPAAAPAAPATTAPADDKDWRDHPIAEMGTLALAALVFVPFAAFFMGKDNFMDFGVVNTFLNMIPFFDTGVFGDMYANADNQFRDKVMLITMGITLVIILKFKMKKPNWEKATSLAKTMTILTLGGLTINTVAPDFSPREIAKDLLKPSATSSAQANPSRTKTWQTVPGSEKPFVGKGIDRNNYVLNLARWGTDIKKGYQIVITSPGNKPFYVGENSEWKKCVKTYERTIDFSTGGNNNWMQAYAENGEVLNFKLLSLK